MFYAWRQCLNISYDCFINLTYTFIFLTASKNIVTLIPFSANILGIYLFHISLIRALELAEPGMPLSCPNMSVNLTAHRPLVVPEDFTRSPLWFDCSCAFPASVWDVCSTKLRNATACCLPFPLACIISSKFFSCSEMQWSWSLLQVALDTRLGDTKHICFLRTLFMY